MDLKSRIAEIIEQHGVKHWSFAIKRDAELLEAIYDATRDLREDIPFPARVYAAMSGDGPMCDNGKERKIKSITTGWGYCGKTGKCPCAQETISRKSRENIDHDARLKKTHETLMKRYGTLVPPQTRVGLLKFYEDPENVARAIANNRKTMLDRYGVDNAFKLDYDRRASQQRHLSEEAKEILNTKEKFEEFVSDKSSHTAALILGTNETTVNNYIRKYDIRREYGSSFENEIAAFLKSYNISFKSRDRTVIYPRELDFYIEDHRLAIEFNGLYWHSSLVIDDLSHEDKWKACDEQGIRLLMIYEDEWINRPDIIKAKILNLCGKSERGVGARKLHIDRISNAEALAFVERHHLQGRPGNCIAAYGAHDADRLVGVLTLSRQRETGALDLNRFCTDGKTYAGLFSRLIKRARQDFDEDIITFADLRYSDGNLYERCGFERVGVIRPDYRYVRRNQTFHKSLFTKTKIAKRFGLDMSNMTEREAMRSLGYGRIYDCGKIKYVLRGNGSSEIEMSSSDEEYRTVQPKEKIIRLKKPKAKVPLDPNDCVTCRVCGKLSRQMTPAHLRTHQMTMAEYVEQFPDAELFNRATRTTIAEKRRGKSHSEKTKALISAKKKGKNHNIEHKLSEETKQKISQKAKERWT